LVQWIFAIFKKGSNSSRATIIRSLKSLCEKNFIIKMEPIQGFSTNFYCVNPEVVSLCNQGGVILTPEGGIILTPNNTTSFINNNTTELPLKIVPNISEKKKFIPPTEIEVIKYFEENEYTKEAGKIAFKYYSIAEWKDSTGKPVKNWKQKMISVWFKPENKRPESGNSFDINDYK
jgi:hypothetical protein